MRRSPKVSFSSMGCAMEEKIGCCEEGEGPSNGTPNRLPGGVSDRVETPPGSQAERAVGSSPPKLSG